jgi:hypothetical protein
MSRPSFTCIVLILTVVLAGCDDTPIGIGSEETDALVDVPLQIGDVHFSDSGPGDAGPDVWGCTATSCATGYTCFVPGGDVTPTCVPDGAFACAPCTSDAVCLGGTCTPVGAEGSFCEIPCISGVNGSSCPKGLTCNDRVCVPDNGSCTCRPGNDGAITVCMDVTETSGSCKGQRTCHAATGWTICNAAQPGPEACNGFDDDCNGQTDEGLSGASCGAGACKGHIQCATGQVTCDGASASTETCNGVDDDCDGITDNGFLSGGLYLGDDNCGFCGNGCAGVISHGTASCQVIGGKATCAVAQCDPGFWKESAKDCVATAMFSCSGCATDADCGGDPCQDGFCRPVCGSDAPCLSGYSCASGLCQPQSGSCSCTPANGASVQKCAVSNDFGTCVGDQTCSPASGWSPCSAATPKAEICNGADDDCDGATDEEVGEGSPCDVTNSNGTCPGTWTCKGASGLFCAGPPPMPDACNGLDDDCNGVTDDAWLNPVTLQYDKMIACGACDVICPPGPLNAEVTCGGAPVPSCQFACAAGWKDMDNNLEDGCECLYQSDLDLPDGVDQNCDGIDGDMANAIFVAKAGNDANLGGWNTPVATIPRALLLAKEGAKRDIYVATGVYTGSLDLVAGISIYGGYKPDFSEHDPVSYQSAIVGTVPASGANAAVRCDGIQYAAKSDDPTRVDGFTIIGADAKTLGSSAYGVWANGCDSRFQLTGSQIQAGDGAAGIPGGSGQNGASGSLGIAGTVAHDVGHEGCGADDFAIGGAGGTTVACAGNNASGGAGGTAVCPVFDEDNPTPQCPAQPYLQKTSPQEPGAMGAGPGGGSGGASGADSYIDSNKGIATQCMNGNGGCNLCHVPVMPRDGVDGQDGLLGDNGSAGVGGAGATGSVVNGVWVAGSGGSGGEGLPGSGGGGGGAAGGVEVHDCAGTSAKYTDIGGSGGGGGSGGCGGSGGLGGGGGGGSFAIFIVPAASEDLPFIQFNTLSSGNGGAGAAGGPAGSGGPGGQGGKGGDSGEGAQATFCTSQGGNGGAGGNAGHGGGGGGGPGGPSALIAITGSNVDPAAYTSKNQLKNQGKGGPGGPGGPSIGAMGKAGAKGVEQKVLTW